MRAGENETQHKREQKRTSRHQSVGVCYSLTASRLSSSGSFITSHLSSSRTSSSFPPCAHTHTHFGLMFSHVTEHKHRFHPVSTSLTCLLRMKSRFPLSRQNFSLRSDTEEDVRTHSEEPLRSIRGCSSVGHTDVPGSKVRVSQGDGYRWRR